MQKQGDTEWYKTRPKVIQKLIRQFPPDCTVRLVKTGQFGTPYSYFEDGTLSAVIDAHRSFSEGGCVSVFGPEEDYRVFGLKPEDLEKL